MKKIVLALALITTSLSAQSTGEGATASAKAAKDYTMQNWIFAGGAAIAAAIGITIVMLSQGASSHHN